MNNYDTPLAKQEDINIKRDKVFDEMIYKLDDKLCEFRGALEIMQNVAKDYKGYDFSQELESHILEEI